MALADGANFGPYRIIGRLGRGGMATVYRAYEAGLDRYVALKALPEDSAQNETAVRRFEQEARAVARLVHPNIVPVLAFGIEEATRTPWMALQLIEGGSLAGVLAQGALDRRRAVGFLRDIASALDYAHSQGVLHRDVKPQNVLVAAGDHAYLADFGLARILESSTALSASGTVLGTPQYMAPEQALGQDLDASCDVYALGIVAYELLAGTPPFQADTPLAVLMKHVREPIPIPAAERVAEPLLRPVLKALAKNRADRWPTALAFVDALEAAVEEAGPEEPTLQGMRAGSVDDEAPTLKPAGPTERARAAPAPPTLAETSGPGSSRRSSRAAPMVVAALVLTLVAIAGLLLVRSHESAPAGVPTPAAPSTLPSPVTATTTLPAPPVTPGPEGAPSQGVIQVRSRAADASVIVDDASPRALPAELRLDAGKHLVEVTRAGCQPARQWLQVAAGEKRRVDMDPSCPTPSPAIAQLRPVPTPTSPAAPLGPVPTPSLKPAGSTSPLPTAGGRAGEMKTFGDGPYAWVPPGTFLMGCTRGDRDCEAWESPAHAVTLTRGFFMATTPVTVAQWRKSGLKRPPAPGFPQEANHPIVNVTWSEADAYCKGVGGRLPTEAEWERAARGGHDDWRYPWGNSVSHDQANYGKAPACCEGEVKGRDRWLATSPVGSFPPNDYGLSDMAGNVWQWNADSMRRYASVETKDPRGGNTDKRVLRGGSWTGGPKRMRVSTRSENDYADTFANSSFRCVRDALS